MTIIANIVEYTRRYCKLLDVARRVAAGRNMRRRLRFCWTLPLHESQTCLLVDTVVTLQWCNNSYYYVCHLYEQRTSHIALPYNTA